MSEPLDEIIAFTEDRVCEFTGISRQRLRRWDRDFDLVRPSIVRELGPRSKIRLYAFKEAIEALMVKELLLRGRSIHQIRRLVKFLREAGYESPLSELRYAVPPEKESREIYIQYPDGKWVGDRAPSHLVIHEVLQLDTIRAKVRQAAKRPAEATGRLERSRGRKGSKLVFAGTRLPVYVVVDYLRQGYSPKQIRDDFPALAEADIALARKAARRSRLTFAVRARLFPQP